MGIQPSSTQKSPELILDFLQRSCRHHVARKCTIIRQGEVSQDLFYIVSGSVTVRIESEGGDEMVVAHLNPGEFFGELGLFGDSATRSASIRAKTSCEIAQVSYDRLKDMPHFLPDLLFLLTRQMADRLRVMNQKYGNLAYMDVAGRVASTLLDLCNDSSSMTHPKGILIRVTRVELAKIVAASRETIGRVLALLEEQGVICVDGKAVVVLQQEAGAVSGSARRVAPATVRPRSVR